MERRQTDPYIRALGDRVTSLETGLAENTAMTAKVEANTSEIVRAWEALEGGFKVLRVLGRVAKYLGYILTAVLAGWAIFKGIVTGIPPGGTP